jgi:5-(carboxyamino)imidazole ribonucleotide synthase
VKRHRPLLPGSTVGILGSGQLGRMLALEARAMGYRVHVFSPGSDTPTGQVADREVTAPYDDLDAVREFASRVDVVTFEFENVPAACAEACAERVPVRPAHRVLHVTQNRLREKTFLSEHDIPVTPFAAVRSDADLEAAFETLGVPAVLKTAGWGYDGKGQEMLRDGATLDDARAAWESIGIGDGEAIWEGFVPYELELSVVAARALDGQVACFQPFANHHENHILDLTRSPAPVPTAVSLRAEEIARRVVEALDVVGVLCVELFWVPASGGDDRNGDDCAGELLVNELAPRPHNSGHLTFGASVTSQFEQQLRTVCGLPLGDVSLHGPAAMANLLGDLWLDATGDGGEPDWRRLLEFPDVKLHLYGKAEPRRGRKMGHLTAIAPPGGGVDDAARRVLEARSALAARARG